MNFQADISVTSVITLKGTLKIACRNYVYNFNSEEKWANNSKNREMIAHFFYHNPKLYKEKKCHVQTVECKSIKKIN